MDRILVVDPEESLRLFYAQELTEEGYDVITSEEGSLLLLDLIARKEPDLVVLEIDLGPHNGLELLQHIRNTYYDLPVILHTVSWSHKGDPRAISADYYVCKSARLSELKLKITMALQSRGGFAGPFGRPFHPSVLETFKNGMERAQ
jgi:DNA-binding response OmpR family regulator